VRSRDGRLDDDLISEGFELTDRLALGAHGVAPGVVIAAQDERQSLLLSFGLTPAGAIVAPHDVDKY
jgi:hypothetical protein